MKPRLRKLALTAHIACSAGWFGAVLTFLAIAVVGLTNQDDRVMRAVRRYKETADTTRITSAFRMKPGGCSLSRAQARHGHRDETIHRRLRRKFTRRTERMQAVAGEFVDCDVVS